MQHQSKRRNRRSFFVFYCKRCKWRLKRVNETKRSKRSTEPISRKLRSSLWTAAYIASAKEKKTKPTNTRERKKARLKSSMFKISWKVELLVKNGYIEWVKHALRAAAKSWEKQEKQLCIKTPKWINPRSNSCWKAIYKYLLRVAHCTSLTPTDGYSERLQHENKSACTVVPYCDKEAPLHAHCSNRERDGEYDDVNAVYVVDAIRDSSVLLHCEMRIITIKITHSKNRP